MKREKTNSITHLVKIIAQEVFDENVEKLKMNNSTIVIDGEKITMSILDSLDKNFAGKKWSMIENNILESELNAAIAQIAKNHGRSRGAIICKIVERQNDLLKY